MSDYIDVEESLRENVEKLRKNEEQVPKEVLETKYEVAYKKQISQVEDLAMKLFIERVAFVMVPKNHAEPLRETIKKLYSQNSISLMETLRKEYSVDRYLEITNGIANEVLQEIFSIPKEEWSSNERYDINPWLKNDGKIMIKEEK